jgi:uncharacterized membrane protein
VALEREARSERTPLGRRHGVGEAAASSTGFIVVHVAWFLLWIGANTVLPKHFDPFPFSLLTSIVSLEAILLTGFVLIAQERMTRLADKRAHLDLQVNLLAEQELTAILRVVCRIAEKSGVTLAGSDPNLDKLLARTDVKIINDELTDEMATVDEASAGTSAASKSEAPR